MRHSCPDAHCVDYKMPLTKDTPFENSTNNLVAPLTNFTFDQETNPSYIGMRKRVIYNVGGVAINI